MWISKNIPILSTRSIIPLCIVGSLANSSLATTSRRSEDPINDLGLVLNALSSTQSSEVIIPLIHSVTSQAAKLRNLLDSADLEQGGETVRAQVACAITKIIFGAQYIDASSPNYIAEVDENWSTTCWLPAACILKSTSAADVAVILKVINLTGSKFAVRSAGHNPNTGFASIDGSGILVDLGNMTSLELSSDRSTLATGPGNRWGDIYNFLDPFAISVIGGREPDVGVGGLLLGGGMPYIPGLFGMACDNVKNFEVVLGNSTIINANATSNSDLFHVLKGGGPNFGIVTRFDLFTVPLHEVWFNFLLFNQSQNEEIIAATALTQTAMESDSKAGLIFNIDGAQTLIGLIYAEHTSFPSVFSAYENIPIASRLAPETNGTIASMGNVLAVEGGLPTAQREPVAVTTLVDLGLYQEAYSFFLTLMNFTTSAAADISFAIQPMSKALVLAGEARGGNVLGLVAEEQTWFNSLAEWTVDSDAVAGHAAVNNMKTKMQDLAALKGLLLDYIFMNDASFTQNPLKSYGAANMNKLKDASLRYDPAQVFQKLQFGGFKISLA